MPSCSFRGCPGDWGVLRGKGALGCAPRRHRHWLRALELGRDQYLALATPTALNTLLWLPCRQSPSPVRAFLHQRAGVLSRLRALGLRPEGSRICRQVFFPSSTGAPSALPLSGLSSPAHFTLPTSQPGDTHKRCPGIGLVPSLWSQADRLWE